MVRSNIFVGLLTFNTFFVCSDFKLFCYQFGHKFYGHKFLLIIFEQWIIESYNKIIYANLLSGFCDRLWKYVRMADKTAVQDCGNYIIFWNCYGFESTYITHTWIITISRGEHNYEKESINECTGTFRVCSSYDRLWKFRQKRRKAWSWQPGFTDCMALL